MTENSNSSRKYSTKIPHGVLILISRMFFKMESCPAVLFHGKTAVNNPKAKRYNFYFIPVAIVCESDGDSVESSEFKLQQFIGDCGRRVRCLVLRRLICSGHEGVKRHGGLQWIGG